MEEILNRPIAQLYAGDDADRLEFFRAYTGFFLKMGYDTVRL